MTNNSTIRNQDLADCTTNVFSLADIRGLRWKKFKCSCVNSTSTIDDPILTAYAVALRLDVLCVWRRVAQSGIHEEVGTRLFSCAKELVIFWYGEEPAITHVPGPSIQEIDCGAIEDGITQDYLDLFFKSIHNIIEKNLLGSDFVRLGKWFTKPLQHDPDNNSFASSLAFRFSIFIHGESTVVTAVNIQEKNAVRCLCRKDLLKKSLHSPNADHKVLLAPHGLNAHLTGYSLSEGDARATKILDEWRKFFPVNISSNKFQAGHSKIDCCPPVVEVMLGEVKMLYPACLVLLPVTSVKENASQSPTTPCFNTCYQDSQELKKCQQKVSTSKVLANTWDSMKHREHDDTKLWEMKENHYQSNCGCCSKTNTRAKTVSNNSSNPFSNNTAVQSYLSSVHSSTIPSKIKKEIQLPLSTFHQRTKPKKTHGRVTPSISGRLTPSISSSNKISTSRTPSTSEKPVGSGAHNNLPVETSIRDSIKCEKQVPFVSPSVAVSMLASISPQKQPQLPQETEKKNKARYTLPSLSKLNPPVLPCNFLDPMLTEAEESLHGTAPLKSEPLEQSALYHSIMQLDPVPTQRIRSQGDSTKVSSECTKPGFPDDATKVENNVERKCSASSPLSPTMLNRLSDDEARSPALSGAVRRNSMECSLSLCKQESPISSPLAQSPASLAHAKSRKRKNITDDGLHCLTTPVTESEVFTFGSKVIRLPSPPTPHFSPSLKTSSLMNTKDLVPISDDLDHLFDDDEEENSGFKKNLSSLMPIAEPINGPPSVEDSSTKLIPCTLSSSVTSSVTQQDLARMFPTPPSPAYTDLSPSMSVHDTQGAAGTPLTCITLLSSEHSSSVLEKEKVEVVEAKQPNCESTFSPPLIQIQEIPQSYLPISLPSDHWNTLNSNKLKYVPTWDPSPPILSRRPSGQRLQTVTGNIDLKQTFATIDSKMNLPLTSPSMHQPYFTISSHSVSPIASSMHDNQSLIVNLTLTDSYMNWISVNISDINNQTVQGKTCKLFNGYQNVYWKTFTDVNAQSSLFPEDISSHFSIGNSTYDEIKLMEKVGIFKITLVPEVTEILLKHFLSPFSVAYLHYVLKKYYSSQSYQLKSNSTVDKSTMQKNKLLNNLHSYLQQALQKPVCKSMFDTPKIEGPLSFRSLDKLSSKKNGIQTVLSASSLLFNYDGDSISISPSAIKHWQHLQLEPCGGTRNVAYVVALPESEFIVNSVKQFFGELNSVYEALNLGFHYPIRDGLFRITQKIVQKVSAITVDDWFNQNDSKPMAKLKTVAQFCKQQLGPYLADLNLDTTSPYKCDSSAVSATSTSKVATQAASATAKSTNPANPASTTAKSPEETSNIINVTVGLQEQSNVSTTASSQSNLAGTVHEESLSETKLQAPTLVIYMVDPFHSEHASAASPNLWSYFGMMRCFVEMKSLFNEKLKDNVLLQVIPLEQILQVDLNARGEDGNGAHSDELKNLALSVYSRCRANPMKWMKKTEKCMTGFGVCNSRDHLIRKRQAEGILYPQLYLPPYMLSEPCRYTRLDGSSDGRMSIEMKETSTNILFCSYCLSTDNHWLLVTCTDKVGELNESTLIKITYPKRKKNKSLIWSIVIRKLWEFISIITSFSVCSWRIVLSKLGNIGQMELKELNTVIRKHIQSTVPTQQGSRPLSPLNEACAPCSVDGKKKGRCTIKSISLCTIDEKCDINFVSIKRTHTNSLNSRIYVMSSSKGHFSNTKMKNTSSSSRSEMLPPDGFLSTPFDEEQEPLQNFLPLLSPSDTSMFQSSPQTDMTKMLSSPQNVVSPQATLNNTMTSLSPFQPIPNKHNYMTSPARSSSVSLLEQGESCGHLSVGYILSASPLDNSLDTQPQILKCDLHQHVTSFTGNYSAELHPLDSNNYVEVLKFVLECFNMLSWLTVDPTTGTRQSCLPVHVRTLSTTQKLLQQFSQ